MKKMVVYAVTGWCFLLFILAAHAILASISQHFYGVVDLQLSNLIGWIGWAVLFLFRCRSIGSCVAGSFISCADAGWGRRRFDGKDRHDRDLS